MRRLGSGPGVEAPARLFPAQAPGSLAALGGKLRLRRGHRVGFARVDAEREQLLDRGARRTAAIRVERGRDELFALGLDAVLHLPMVRGGDLAVSRAELRKMQEIVRN